MRKGTGNKKKQPTNDKQSKKKSGVDLPAKIPPPPLEFLGVEEEEGDSDDEDVKKKNPKEANLGIFDKRRNRAGEGAEEEEEEDTNETINYKQSIMNGSFLPVMLLLQRRLVKIEDLIDEAQGLRLLHYACYFGKIKALKALVELYGAELNAIDYRG